MLLRRSFLDILTILYFAKMEGASGPIRFGVYNTLHIGIYNYSSDVVHIYTSTVHTFLIKNILNI